MKSLILLSFLFISVFSFGQVTTTLDGSGSSDSDGTIAAYKWRQVSGPTTVTFNTSVAKPSVIFSISGTYVFGLIVTDNEGGVSTEDVVQITVGAANQKPKANAGPDQILKLPGTAMLNLKTIYENKGYALACYIRLSHI